MGCCNDRILIKSNKIKGISLNKGRVLENEFMCKYYVGEFFLLEKENKILNLEEKVNYIDKLNYLLTISDYVNQIKLKKRDLEWSRLDSAALNNDNHKELFLFMILNIDITIINNQSTFQKLYYRFKSNIQELKEIIINGPPQVFRSILWKIFIKLDTYIEIDENSFNKIINTDLNDNITRQIDCDVLRTFPNIAVFRKNYCSECIRSTLENIAKYHKDLAYVQGMNYIIAFILLIFGFDKIESFNFALNIFNLRSHLFVTFTFKEALTDEFSLLFNYINKLKEKLHEKYPSLLNKLETANINEFLWFSKWLQTLFTYQFDLFISIRLWDIILVKGIDTIIDISLCIIGFYEEEISSHTEIEAIIREIEKIYKINDKTMKMINHIINEIV